MIGPLVLIEPYAHRLGGHHHRTLVALARVQPGAVVIAPYGVAAETRVALQLASAQVTSPVGSTATVLLAASTAIRTASAAAQRAFGCYRWPTPLRRIPHQITLLARCLTEAACLRTSRRLVPKPATAVVLSASEALHGAAVLLGGLPHLRFVHEAVTAEDLPLRLLGRVARHGEKRVLALYPTAAVRDQLAQAFPHLPGSVRPYAVDDEARITERERADARAAFAIPDAEPAVCLVGGWWPYKDIATIDVALTRLRHRVHLLVTGNPLQDGVLQRWRALPQLRLHTRPGPVSEQTLRSIYAAADAALVARHRGVGKESGLVIDAVRLGVPLIVSDHDPDLTTRLAGQDWARIFPAGAPDTLAQLLDGLASRPQPPRPGPDAARRVGIPTAAEQAAFLMNTYTRLREHGCRLRHPH
jgi:glycosyltransferase involved in cell wall biosynthesis